MKDLKSEIVLKIRDNQYTVKFPDTGTLIDLEQKKAQYSSVNPTKASSLWAHNLAMAIITFSNLIPNLKKDLNITDFNKMSVRESKELVEIYIKEFLPWFNEWIEEISDIFSEKDEE